MTSKRYIGRNQEQAVIINMILWVPIQAKLNFHASFIFSITVADWK